MNNKKKLAVVGSTAFLIAPFLTVGSVYAAKGDYGVDNAKFQGQYGQFGYAHDKFLISQIGGYYNGRFIPQKTYSTQVKAGIAQGKRVHTYIYDEAYGINQTDAMLDYYLPQIQTPKDSIVALDIESGNPDVQSVMHGLKRIERAGYTPMLYGYKGFLIDHLGNNGLQEISNHYQLWLAEYPNYNVTPTPNYNFFPSFNNVGIFQFTSTYIKGGLDGDIDLTGITDNGYTKHNNPKTNTPAISQGKQADHTPKRDIKVGDVVKVNFSSSKWSTGQFIPNWVKGKSYTVKEISGNKLLLDGIMSWINRSDVEILSTTNKPIPLPHKNNNIYVVKAGDSWWSIAHKFNMNMYDLARINGKTIYNVIYPNEQLVINSNLNSNRIYVVKRGDTLYGIANKLGINAKTLASRNHIWNINFIRVGQRLTY